MKIAHTLIAAASLALLATAPAVAQRGGHGGGGGFHGGGGGGYHGGGGGYHGGGGWHGGGYGRGYRGWGGGYGWGGYGYGDAFALGLFGGYAIGAYPWGYDDYYYDAPPPPPPGYGVYDRPPPADFGRGPDAQSSAQVQSDDRHCPLFWNQKTGRYEPNCS